MTSSTVVLVFTLLAFCSCYVTAQQRFSLQPQDKRASKATDVFLKCTIENLVGNPQWTKDGVGLGKGRELPGWPRYSIVGAENLGEYELMLSNVMLDDEAEYQCQVAGTTTTPWMGSSKAMVTILLPCDSPVIEGGDLVEVVADEEFNLTCNAQNGKPAPQISWYQVGGDQIKDGIWYSVTNHSDSKRQDATSLLTIKPKKSEEGKQYECKAINEAMTIPKVKRFAITVLYPPEVSMTVNPSRKLKEGGTAKFMCDSQARPAEVTWKWFLGDKEIDGETASTLVLTDVSRTNHGNKISCEATNKVGSTKQTYTMNVEYGPRFTAPAKHAAVDPGESVSLSCDVDSNPDAAIYWTRKNSERVLSSSTKFELSDVMEKDFGVYTCTATSLQFGEVNMDVHLLKRGPPRILSSTDQYAVFGETGKVVCSMRSAPKPSTVIWVKDGKILDIAKTKRYALKEEDFPDGKKTYIEITSVQEGDFGQYNCSVDNGYGTDNKLITFSRQNVVSLAHILGAVLVGVVIIIIIVVAVFIYHRNKKSTGDTSSDNSETSMTKKKDSGPDIKVEYKDPYGPIDNWRHDFDNKNYHRYSAEYDELSYPNKAQQDPRMTPYDFRDGGYGGFPPPPSTFNIYGTYPRTAPGPPFFDQRPPFDPIYGTAPVHAGSVHAGSDYGNYGTYRSPSRQDYGPPSAAPYGPLNLRPISPVSRLSTNV